MKRPKLVLIAPESLRKNVFPEQALEKIRECADWSGEFLEPGETDGLEDAEVLMSTWGLPQLDEAFLAAAPRLRLVLYAAGSVKGFVTPSVWERGVRVSSAWAANAIPVAEFTLATVLLSLKRFWHFTRAMRSPDADTALHVPGAFGSKVGLVSLGAIGRLVVAHLRRFDLEIFATDPFFRPEEAAELGVRLVSLDQLFAECDVVSVHAPWLPETEGLVSAPLVASMKSGATLINTSRGAVIDEPGLCRVLTERPDLSAVRDVTHPEPAAADSPLRRLPNVELTPHIAGSIQRECGRLGLWMARELDRFARGEPLEFEITREKLEKMA